ncbi:MAG TPA: ABC transporter permease [Vicinamibacterales bacterium]|nr:ABC transporter permease [Vicinamibacterales bacterium]
MNDTRRTSRERLYRGLLRLFPPAFRERFAPDLVDLFRDKHQAARARGRIAVAIFWFVIVSDVVMSAAVERMRKQPAPPDGTRGPLMEGLLQDVRYACRTMARRPALSMIIIATLALGIGANTAIFSLVNTVLLRSQPYLEPDRLVEMREQQVDRAGSTRPVIPANFFEWRERATSFEDIAWSRDIIFSLTGEGEPESVIGYRFSANMLDVLGVQPALGRGIRPDEDRAGAQPVVILGDKLWRRRYGADPGILGRSIILNGQAHTVIGVMPPAFTHPQAAELWTPVALDPELQASRTAAVLRLVGRLAPGISREQAQAEVSRLYQDLAARYPATNKGLTTAVRPFGGTGDAKPLLLTLFAGVGFVLLIACANVANLLLADVTSRRRELAVRSALGASRYRVARQVLTESLVLALIGGALGMVVTWWTRNGLVALFPENIANLDLPLVERIDIGPAVFAFALIVSIATGLLFGMLPAWTVARSNLPGALKDGGRTGSGSRRTHGALVVAEVSLSVVLLAGALLMVQSFMRLQRLDFGFDVERVMSGRVILPPYRYADEARIAAFTRELVPRLQSIPGVEAAGVTNYLPLSGWGGSLGFTVEGQPQLPANEQPSASYHAASEDYFRAMGIRLIAGRTFTPRDTSGAPPVVVVNETLARQHWPGENPVGRRVLIGTPPEPHEIVGLVGDVKLYGLEQPTEGQMFFSYWQVPDPVIGIVLRSNLAPESLAARLRAAVWSVDRDQPVTFVMPMSELAAESLAFRRAGMILAGGFGTLALLLAAIGIYGVLSYSVSRRTREMGVRVALGATRSEVARLVVREGLMMTGIGIALGLAAAAALTKYLTNILYEVKPGDPLTYVAVAAILLMTALVATWMPARRATGVDPLIAIRAE